MCGAQMQANQSLLRGQPMADCIEEAAIEPNMPSKLWRLELDLIDSFVGSLCLLYARKRHQWIVVRIHE